jgi:ABC-2 type transport system ATP-binding protein
MIGASEQTKNLAELRHHVDQNPRAAEDEVLAFLRDYTVVEGQPRADNLHFNGVMELKYLRSTTQDTGVLKDLLNRLLKEAELRIKTRTDSATELVIQRLKARDRLRGRQIEKRTAFHCSGLGKTYPDFKLEGIDLELKLGEITGVVGENANGKTTLFRLMVGENRPSVGQMTFPELGQTNVQKINWAAVHTGLAYVPQTLSPWPGSLEDNLRFAAASHGILGEANDRAFEYIVERMSLREQLNKPWKILSGGFRLRFELAKALIWSPKILVLDEPLANLDFRAQWTVLRDIRRMSRSYTDPIAVIISSQHLHEIEALADNILFLRAGSVVFNGPRGDIGKTRSENAFEVICELPLQQALQPYIGNGVRSVMFDGMSHVVVTDVGFGAVEMLQTMMDIGCPPSYFRDISRSVKRLFDTQQDKGAP